MQGAFIVIFLVLDAHQIFKDAGRNYTFVSRRLTTRKEGISMNLRRSTLRFGIAAAAVTGVLAGTATSASAIPFGPINSGSGGCPANHVCMWSESDFRTGESRYGVVGSAAWDAPHPNTQEVEWVGQMGGWQGMRDNATSVVNNTWNNVCFYENTWYSGLEFRIQGKEKWAYVPWWIDNKIESLKWC
ncbi:peptidase inhibitor family I36 protein [Streptomyces sp. NPDC051219]|uniref:peptidase inhibitor family I36 protein n=1 Tax=Streptomyces sp. NPDC051219 TaxID=3155283 RepID=UPI0034201B4C